MDGHWSHRDAEAFSIAEQNSIKILLLPAHTSHELQPLDVAVFKPLKQAFYDQSKFWHAQHPGRGLNKLSFSDVFTAWNKAATCENAVAGFEATSGRKVERSLNLLCKNIEQFRAWKRTRKWLVYRVRNVRGLQPGSMAFSMSKGNECECVGS